MNMVQLLMKEFAGEIEVLGEIMAQCYFVHQKSHMT
jgi:hypothetical protein